MGKKKWMPELVLQDFLAELAKEIPDLSRFEGVKIALPDHLINEIIAPYNEALKSNPHSKKAYKAYTFTIEQFTEPSTFYDVVIMQMAFNMEHKSDVYGSYCFTDADSCRLKLAAEGYIRRKMRTWMRDGGSDFLLPVSALEEISCIQDEFFKWYDMTQCGHLIDDLQAVVHEVYRTKLLLTADKQRCIHGEDYATLLRIAKGFEKLANMNLLKVYTGYAGSGKSTNARFYMKNKGLVNGCVITLANLLGRDFAKKANAMGLHFIQASISKCMHCGIQLIAGGADGIVIDEFSQWGAAEMDVLWSIIDYCISKNKHLFILGDTHQITSFLGRGNFLSGLCQRFQGVYTTDLSEPDEYTVHIIKNVIHRQDGEQEKEDIISYINTGDIATFFSKHRRKGGVEWLELFKKVADLSIEYETPLNNPTSQQFITSVDACLRKHIFLTGGNINTDYQNILILRQLFELTGTPLCKRQEDNAIDYLATLKQMYRDLPYDKRVFIPLIGTANYVEAKRDRGKIIYTTRVRNKDRLVLLYIDSNNEGRIYNDTTGDIFLVPIDQVLKWVSSTKLCNTVLPIDKDSGCKTAQLARDGSPCITFGYSVNVNNSQGMEWDEADLIFHRRFTDMHKQGSPDYNIMNYEAYYVAITRHKTNFRVLNNSKSMFKQVKRKRFIDFFSYKEI